MEKIYDVIIIGAGPSGLYNSIILKKGTPLQTVSEDLDVMVIEASSIPGGIARSAFIQLTKSWAFSGTTLVDSFYQEAKSVGVNFKFNEIISNIYKDQNENFILEGKTKIYRAKYVVVATGIMTYPDFLLDPKKTNIALHTSEELIKEIKIEYSWKKILIVGNNEKSVSLLQSELADNFEAVDIYLMEKDICFIDIKKTIGVDLYDKYDGILFDYSSYKINNGTTGFLKTLGVEMKNGYVVTNSLGETNIKNLYAIGTSTTPVSGILAATYTAEVAGFAIGRQIDKKTKSDPSGRFPYLPKEIFWEYVEKRYK